MMYIFTEQNCIIEVKDRYNDGNIGQNVWTSWIAT